MSYDLLSYASMCADSVRLKAYYQALQEVITPESVVLDLGAGTGVFSLMSAQLGAKKIYAVENNSAVQILRELARENNFQDRIEVIESEIEQISLPNKVDIIVSDLRGRIPLYAKNPELVKFAKDNFLKENGYVIPLEDKIYLALSSDLNLYRQKTTPWDQELMQFSQKKFSNYLKNCFHPCTVDKKFFISDPQHWATISYKEDNQVACQSENIFSLEKGQTVYGFYLWFDSKLTEKVGFSTGADFDVRVYGKNFFPFEQPIKADEKTEIKIVLLAQTIDQEVVWFWKTFRKREDKFIELYNQSTFFASPLSSLALKRKENNLQDIS